MAHTVLGILGTYLVVQVSILLFALPFYALYRLRYVPDDGPKVDINRHLEYFFASKYANYLVFFWALGEAVVWFVIPEFLLLLIVFMRVKRKPQLLLYDIYGTTAGTLLALVMHLSPSHIASLPFIQPKMVTQVHEWFDRLGIWGLIYQPFSGVPYKVFNHVASDYHFFIPAFLVVAVVVRMSRYLIAYFLLSSIYPVLHKYVYRNYVPLVAVATFIFSILLYKVVTSFAG